MALKISINSKDCIGCGSCEAVCPEVFEMNDGKPQIKKIDTKKIGSIKEAVESCPIKAIDISGK